MDPVVEQRRVIVIAMLVLLIAASGCFSVGSNFSARPVRKIEKGVSTKAQVEEMFGEPFRTGLDDGYESWTYLYNQWILFSAPRSKDLYIVFNRDGTVRTYTYNTNFND